MSSNPNVKTTPGPKVIAAPTIAEALDNATGLIRALVARIGITLELRTGALSRPTDWMSVEIRRISVIPENWITLVAAFQINLTPVPSIIIVFVAAPWPEFQHDRYEVRNTQYRNAAGNIPGVAFDQSSPAAFRVDTIAPYAVATSREQPAVPVFTNAPPGTIINNAFLADQGGLEIRIPANEFGPEPGRFETGDLINLYFAQVMDPRPEYLVSGPGIPMLPTGGTFFLPAAQIILTGLYYLFYTITDRAGNVSRPSFNDFRHVALLEDPVLLPLFVPKAAAPRDGSTDDLLDILDYRSGIEAHIEEYLEHAIGLDRFEVQWEALPFGPQTSALDRFPVVVNNMNDAIKASYTAPLGPQTVSVGYRADRNGIFFRSPVKTLRLDLSVEGPVLPGTLEPGDVNPALNLAQVFGADSAPELNTLRIGDANQDVIIVIALWTIAVLPHIANKFFLFWGETKERVGPFDFSTIVPGANATFTIPWAVVARHGNQMQPVSYSVIGPGTTNENPSGVTMVNVIDAVTVVMPAAEYLHLDGLGEWSCESLLQRMPGSPPVLYGQLFIPGDPRFVVGNTLTVTITISNDFPGLPPGPFVQTLTTPPLTLANVQNGVTVDVTYRPFLAQVPFGPCEVTYITTLAGGVTGRGEPAQVYTGFSNPDSFCDRESFVPTP